MRQRLAPSRGVVRLVGGMLLDAAVVVGAYWLALLLRFDGDVPAVSRAALGDALPLVVPAYLGVFLLSGIYRTVWRYGGAGDVLNLGRAVLLVTVAIFLVNRTREVREIPLSVNLVGGGLIFILSGFVKLAPRLTASWRWSPRPESRRMLIVGAGATGQFIAREFRAHPEWLYEPVAFSDDDRRKFGMRLHGLKVAGKTEDIPHLIRRYDVDLVALAIPSAPGATIREIVALCDSEGVPVRTVPGLPEMVQSGPGPAALRELTVEDLIGRESVEIDYAACLESLRNKRVLITGAAGSVGSELAAQVLAFGPASLHLLDNNETGLHDLGLALRGEDTEVNLRPWIGDITDEAKLRRVFEAAQPQIVFHAAAYKHVPMLEEHPDEALRVNIDGTLNVCRAADRVRAEKLVFISTDKGIDPASVYGASKRIGELIVLAFAGRSRTTFCAVRFVNVIGSRGSVVTVFSRQIERGGPVTVTDPEMRRYYLTIPEAARLVIQAAAFAGQGEIYMLDTGEEVRIVDLAERMIRMRGLTPGEDVAIVYTDSRPGEKLREDLIAHDEERAPTEHPKVVRVQSAVRPSLALLEAEIETARALAADRAAVAGRIQALARGDAGPVGTRPLDDRL